VGNEETALKMDAHMQNVHKQMQAHPGYETAVRQVCKSEWAYELSFVFADLDSFKAWKDCDLQKDVHSVYLEALKDAGIAEADVYSGARVHDTWN
jgi:antibiotic biosynthesis monooxygenase (ABM) superfamily enzyme